jgi:hypothetical protein
MNNEEIFDKYRQQDFGVKKNNGNVNENKSQNTTSLDLGKL